MTDTMYCALKTQHDPWRRSGNFYDFDAGDSFEQPGSWWLVHEGIRLVLSGFFKPPLGVVFSWARRQVRPAPLNALMMGT
ncbi:MAG: hypothetical protein HY019_10120 [Aquabacterium sp.]|uniref:hypothetical protein n=1 Tax=Aquabacterium sp. TaxID=1872578 RepID=UPI0025C7283D|nr:hypothetical protein [Aquabacterium sp.]MBI3382347.1 hypothetical protein [Aquabacterium sp.]